MINAGKAWMVVFIIGTVIELTLMALLFSVKEFTLGIGAAIAPVLTWMLIIYLFKHTSSTRRGENHEKEN